jgi:hypothetical protein
LVDAAELACDYVLKPKRKSPEKKAKKREISDNEMDRLSKEWLRRNGE